MANERVHRNCPNCTCTEIVPRDIEKRCSSCKQVKLIHEFSMDRSRVDGLHPQCKVCRNAGQVIAQRNRRKRNREANAPDTQVE